VSTHIPVLLRCSGCAAVVDPADPFVTNPYRCPNADRAKDVDHVLTWSPTASGVTTWPSESSVDPFVRYRTLQHSYWLHRALGRTDADHINLVERLQRRIADVCGTPFLVTPFDQCDRASEALGAAVWAKDDTGNVSGSHKARHIMGLLLHLEIRKVPTSARLALASCGNAALGAATLAKAARRPLDVFVPPSANPAVLERLRALQATIHESPRLATDPPGDPCMHRFHEQLSRGAIPFCVQGPENGLAIDGGTTLGHELADQLAVSGTRPTRLVIQVGGGALGTAATRGLGDAVTLGQIPTIPPVHFVQSNGAAPFRRSWEAVTARALSSLGRSSVTADGDAAVAAALMEADSQESVKESLRWAATHRSRVMWPWEDEPHSVASGILDDETYDWFSLLGVTLCTGGWPVVVTDQQLIAANEMSGSAADETGTSGLAGAVALQEQGDLRADDIVVAFFTGIRRTG
jgi:threonine synthase